MTLVLLISLLALGAFATPPPKGPFTSDFVTFLDSREERFAYVLQSYRDYGDNGSFGGKTEQGQKIKRDPVIFVHGNADGALYFTNGSGMGWSAHIDYFKDRGYTSAELYGATYGDRNVTTAVNNHVSCKNIGIFRNLIEAVLEYTQTEKVDVVGHSMGVTLGRLAIQGGDVVLRDERCSFGGSLANKVDAFVGLAGPNYGLCVCLLAGLNDKRSCSSIDGFFSGTCGKAGEPDALTSMCHTTITPCQEQGFSSVLKTLNDKGKDAGFVASLWSRDDDLIGKGNFVWGLKTSLIPRSDFEYEATGLNHWEVKDKMIDYQFNLVTTHSRTGSSHHHHKSKRDGRRHRRH